MSRIDWSKITILVAEDEFVIYMLIEQILLETGATVLQAIDGEEAVRQCKDNKNIDLVLMDLKMPGINGFEATQMIKEFAPDMPIIAQTAIGLSDHKERAIQLGCFDCLEKPFDKETLLYVIEKALNRF